MFKSPQHCVKNDQLSHGKKKNLVFSPSSWLQNSTKIGVSSLEECLLFVYKIAGRVNFYWKKITVKNSNCESRKQILKNSGNIFYEFFF